MHVSKKIKDWIKETLKVEEDFAVEHPSDLKNGDYSTNVAMVLSKSRQTNPAELANEFGRALSENKIPEVGEIKVAGGFINFYLSKEFFAGSVKEILEKEDKVGETDLFKGQKVIIEHTQPNPFKEFHIGHLMNNAIGESVARIIKANGAEAKVASYHGDIGLHVAKAIWGKLKKPELTWGEAYAYGAKNYEDYKGEITEINKKVFEKSDEDINKLYDEGKEFSLRYFESLYKRLDSHFDEHFFENISGEIGKRLVLENVGKIFEESEGAVIFRGENFEPKTHTRVFINSDGIPTYEAKELGLADIKKEAYFPYDKSITVTANEQDAFFDVTEVAIGEVFPELKGKLKHLSHGMLRLPTGKMSSRTGDVITAESLINQVKEKVLSRRFQSGSRPLASDEASGEKIKDREFSDAEKGELAEIVAIGAIKYSILRQAIGGDIIFDFEKSISFEGDSGPYLQYAHTRAKSVLEKAKAAKMISSADVPDFPSENTASEFIPAAVSELERYLYRFPEVVERAGKEYAPHYIVTYLTELASVFNSFYAKEKIIDEKDPASPYKIALTRAVAHVLKSGLSLLGIKVPDKM